MVYFFGLLLIVFWVDIMGGSKIVKTYNNFEKGIIFVFLGMLLIIGCRSIYVGTDTLTYAYEFIGTKQNQTSDIWELLTTNTEPLYKILLIVCRRFTNKYIFFFLVAALPISVGFSYYIKRYSDDYLLSFILFILLGILGFSMAGLRQSISLGISLFAYGYAKERKKIPFLLCCLVTFGFHNSSLVLLVIYPLACIRKIDLKWWAMIAVAFVLGITKNGIVLKIASYFFTQDRYNLYGTSYTSNLNYTMLLIQLGLLIFCFVYKNVVLEDDEKNSLLYIMAFIGTMFQCFTPILGEFFRISLYFSVSLCILVPKTICLIKDIKIKGITYFGIVGIGIYYILFASSSIARTYAPFWSVGSFN